MSQTKDYIYLDEDLLNSHLAQFEKGLLIKEKVEHGTESSESNESSDAATIGVNGIFGIGAKIQSEIGEKDSSLESEFTKSMVENVLSDYAVDLLIEDCKTNRSLSDFNKATEGDFVLFTSEFQIFDFEFLKSITDPDAVKPILERDTAPQKPTSQASSHARAEYKRLHDEYQNQQKAAKDGYKILNDFSSYASILFEDSILITLKGGLAICKRDKVRLNKAQVSFENESSRKLNFFGVVSSTKKETHPDGITEPFNPNQLDKVSSVMFDILLSNFNMLHNGDKIIKPIAIYFEAE